MEKFELKTERDHEVWIAALKAAHEKVTSYAEESKQCHGMGAWWRGAWESANVLGTTVWLAEKAAKK